MRKKFKVVVRATTKEGVEMKSWLNRKTGLIQPTHWKIQAGYLTGALTYFREKP